MSDIEFSSKGVELNGTRPDAWIIITPLNLSDPQAHSVESRVEVHLNEYSGAQKIYLFFDDIENFIQQLHSLEKSRSGRVTWQMPGNEDTWEFDLSLESIDRAGHMKAGVKIQCRHWYDNKCLPQSLSGEFEFYSGSLNKLIVDFQQLMQLKPK